MQKKPKISSIQARQIIDSRGNPTVEVDLYIQDKILGRAAVPSGASTGEFEAMELRDKDPNIFHGKGVMQAVKNIQDIIAKEIINKEYSSQQNFDQVLIDLDGTENKSKLGANAILGVSLAYYRACCRLNETEPFSPLDNSTSYHLPVPMVNIINGGMHANNSVDIQEFMIVPTGFFSFKRALQSVCEIFQSLKKILHEKKYSTEVGDEGGFAPNLSSNQEALELLVKAIEKAGYKAGEDIFIALDIAASELYQDKKYYLASENRSFGANEFTNYLQELVTNFPIISIEDGLDENDWETWQLLTQKIGKTCQLVGDDFLVTNTKRLKKAIEKKAGNAILIKPNQIGTFSETLAAVRLAKDSNYGCIISHRSGETEDIFIANFAVATKAGQIKTGSVCRSERTAKYNQLLRIEELAGNSAIYQGKKAFAFLENFL